MSEKVFGLLGRTLGHSFSKAYFTQKFKDLNLDYTYKSFELSDISEFKNLVRTEKNLVGLNVTTPYKEAVIPFLDELNETAQAIGAVNTILIKEGKKIGYNSDVFGFKQMIKPFFKSHHEKAIILGTGGASKAVAYVLENLGCEPIFISRSPKGDNQFGYEDINKLMIEACPVIVNTTPLGTFPNNEEMPDIPTQLLTDKNLVIDLIYNPTETKLLKAAKEQNAWTLNGLTMLHQQAEKSWQIWNEQ